MSHATNKNPRTLRFYFDFISHNAYIAWTQLPSLAEQYGCLIEPVPVLFAGLLQAYKQLGPAEVPPKLQWMLGNTLRKASLLGIPLNPPATHPFNPLLALRVSSLDMSSAQRSALVDSLFHAVWVDGKDVTDPDTVMRTAVGAGLQSRDVIREAGEDIVKALVRQQTEDAIAAGVFGVPTMVIDRELFWGYDDFPYLELFLAGKDPLPSTERQRWLQVRASAARKATERS